MFVYALHLGNKRAVWRRSGQLKVGESRPLIHRVWPNGDRINQGLFRAFDPAPEAGFRRPTSSNDHAMISASPAPMCVTWTTSSCHDSAPVAPAWLAAMGNVCVVPHQELATSDRAMAHVNQAATTITQTDLSPTLCGSASSAVARTMNSIPFVTNWM